MYNEVPTTCGRHDKLSSLIFTRVLHETSPHLLIGADEGDKEREPSHAFAVKPPFRRGSLLSDSTRGLACFLDDELPVP